MDIIVGTDDRERDTINSDRNISSEKGLNGPSTTAAIEVNYDSFKPTSVVVDIGVHSI